MPSTNYPALWRSWLARIQVFGRATAFTNLDEAGERIIAFEEFCACALYQSGQEDFATLREVDHVLIG